MAREGRVVYEFCDGMNNTYQVIDWDKYVEVSLVLVNIEKKYKKPVKRK